jgi:phenylpyruvate tautomerase PptA (4-oxalocrotonate tautomerase family)
VAYYAQWNRRGSAGLFERRGEGSRVVLTIGKGAVPSVLIEVRRTYTEAEEIAIMDAVHTALLDAFKILPTDRHVRLLVHAPHRFACPPGREQPDKYTHISIDAFAGRTLEAKRNLYRAIVTNLQALGIPPDHVKILLREIPRENWGIRGGRAGCDVELGFEIQV